MKPSLILCSLIASTTFAQSANIIYASGSTTDVVRIENVVLGGDVQDIVFFTGTFSELYGTTAPFSVTEAPAIQNEINAILNGTSPQSPFFPLDLVVESTPILSVLGAGEFLLPSGYRSFNPGTGRPDFQASRGSFGSNGFSQSVWGGSIASREVDVT